MMSAITTAPHRLDAVSPVALASYLHARGWQRGPQLQGGLAQIWQWRLSGDAPGDLVDVIVPGARELRDFRRRVQEVLQTLETLEEKSQLDILADIQAISSDVIRWRWIQASSQWNDDRDGTIPLEQGHQFFAMVRNQLLAAACSAAQPSQFFASGKPARAVEFLRQARLGQSERGSYVITVQNPVPPAMCLPGLEDETEPFERQVTVTLSRALQCLRRVATETISGGPSLQPAELSREGVSANLCESVAAMLAAGDVPRDIEVRFAFSGARPVPGEPPRLTRFSSDLSPVIGEIGKVLRETATREDFELVGFVTDLSRGPHDRNGIATVQGVVDEDYRRVEIEVGAEIYDAILTPAHRDREMIRCEGELQKVRGRTYRLTNARGFRLLASE